MTYVRLSLVTLLFLPLLQGCNKPKESIAERRETGELIDDAVKDHATKFNPESFHDTRAWLARLVLEHESRANTPESMVEISNQLKVATRIEVAWKLPFNGNNPVLGGTYNLPIGDEHFQVNHRLYISMSAKDDRPSIALDPNSENPNTHDVRVIPLLEGKDALSNRYQQLIKAHNAAILVTGRVASIVYVDSRPSHIKIYLEDCVPRIPG